VPEALHGSEWTLLATVGPLVIGVVLIIWVVWKGWWRDHVRIHRRSFNEEVLKGWGCRPGQEASKSKDAGGWEHDGQIIRELKAWRPWTAWARGTVR
jgi:hypothetical protein